VRDLFLLTMKPVVYVANIGEGDLEGDSEYVTAMAKWAQSRGYDVPVTAISAKLESELAELDPIDAAEFLEELGIQSSALARIILASYEALDLITFYTTKGDETRAWTVKQETAAPQAAGVIHSDMEQGFIKAEVIGYESLMTIGSLAGARDKGLVRQEGRDYMVKDGDVILFRFSEPSRK
jgi:ribosome-binding ATPase YchF (GTP1/OBG family)